LERVGANRECRPDYEALRYVVWTAIDKAERRWRCDAERLAPGAKSAGAGGTATDSEVAPQAVEEARFELGNGAGLSRGALRPELRGLYQERSPRRVDPGSGPVRQRRLVRRLIGPPCPASGSVLSAVSSIGLISKPEAPPLTLQPLRGALLTVAFPTPVNATTDKRNDKTKPTRFTNEAELRALFEHAVRAIGFYEAQRNEVLMALESLGRALNSRPPKPPTPYTKGPAG
jgi:hypothetical protein